MKFRGMTAIADNEQVVYRFVLLNESYSPYSGGAGLDAVFGNQGYCDGIQITPPTEVGLDLHYSFGAR